MSTIPVSDQERIDADIFDLCHVSETINTYISTQSYLSKYGPEGVSDTVLLVECYGLVEEELKELGIYLDDRDIYDDFWSLKSLYALRKLFDAETLEQYLTRDTKLKTALAGILDESNDLVNDVLDIFFTEYEMDSLVRMAEDLWLRCHSDTALKDHLTSILRDEHPKCTLTDSAGVKTYLDFIIKGRVDVAEAIRRVYAQFPWMDKTKLDHLVDVYDMDKINTDTIAMYALFDKEDEPLPDAIAGIGKRWMDAHHMRISHHIEYWLAHTAQHVSYEDLAILVGHHWHPETKETAFMESVASMLVKGAAALSDDDTRMAHTLAKAMLRAAPSL